MKWTTYLALLSLGIGLRTFVRVSFSDKILNSFIYSPIDQWEAVQEGVYLKTAGLPHYDNDIVHQPPLVLSLWRWLLAYFGEHIAFCFMIFELVLLVSLVKLCRISSDAIQESERRKKSVVHRASRDMLRTLMEDFGDCECLAVLWYCFNPYSILSSADHSTSILWNIVCVWTLIAYTKDHLWLSSCLCALGCYIRLYPGYLLVAIIAKAYASDSGILYRIFRIAHSLVGFASTLAALLYASYLLEDHSWAFLRSVYWHQLQFKDCSPQLSVYWYLFVEMFEHFHEFFIWVFQLLLATLVIGLGLRFYYEPVFLVYLILLTSNVLQPYPSIGEFGYLLALLPLWRHLYQYTRMPLLVVVVLLSALLLTPLLYYLWLQPGTANANFYFAACMAYAVGQIFLIGDLMNSFIKREYLLRVGPELQLSTGEKLVLTHS